MWAMRNVCFTFLLDIKGQWKYMQFLEKLKCSNSTTISWELTPYDDRILDMARFTLGPEHKIPVWKMYVLRPKTRYKSENYAEIQHKNWDATQRNVCKLSVWMSSDTLIFGTTGKGIHCNIHIF